MEQKNTKLPEIEIEGTIFQFDIEGLVFIEKEKPSNTISLVYMVDHGTHYSFDYSTVSKNHHSIRQSLDTDQILDVIFNPNKLNDPAILVEIPRIAELDPLRFSQRYECSFKEMTEKTDFELMVDQDAFRRRTGGEAVKVSIAGNPFEIDPVHNILISTNGKEDINLNNLRDYYDSKLLEYHIFYDIQTGKTLDVLNEGHIGNDSVRLVIVPDVAFLDPIGKNRAANLPDRFGLPYFNLNMHHDLVISKNEIDQEINVYKNALGQSELHFDNTTFLVDIQKFELRDKHDPTNVIPLSEMCECDSAYKFKYNRKEFEIPEFVSLDPEGMAKKYNVSIQEVQAHDDFHFMVDQEAYNLRMNGKLPTIDLDGHTFTVDMRMNMLRSASDFHSKGINFDDIDHYYSEERDAYIIPYDPKKREFRELDYDNLFNIPTDLIAVEFPFQTKLDPIGWNREGGYNLKDDLKWIGVKSHFIAKVIPWEQTYIVDIINDNKEERKMKEDNHKKNNPTNQNKGRKM
ncbi:hypothetical protein [Sphingobacterium sp. DR205]|uniref:hypothetical protein n=1 Tax=Sphingobacterium sp. DR205 TaxID=2713573 RepID=UPI0013E450F9|nr:hypothetical protein [Sphingobacterium sp. DR205]QIH34502.1 hypothetical protein G6053_17105 [Sphingobacterium sp. DR205]